MQYPPQQRTDGGGVGGGGGEIGERLPLVWVRRRETLEDLSSLV
jgi:hypothetical protein